MVGRPVVVLDVGGLDGDSVVVVGACVGGSVVGSGAKSKFNCAWTERHTKLTVETYCVQLPCVKLTWAWSPTQQSSLCEIQKQVVQASLKKIVTYGVGKS